MPKIFFSLLLLTPLFATAQPDRLISVYESQDQNRRRETRFMFSNPAISGKADIEVVFHSDTTMFHLEQSFPDLKEATFQIGYGNVKRYYNRDKTTFAYVFTPTTQRTCGFCIHFDGGNRNDLWIEPNGKVFYRGKVIYQDFGMYLNMMGVLMSIEKNLIRK